MKLGTQIKIIESKLEHSQFLTEGTVSLPIIMAPFGFHTTGEEAVRAFGENIKSKTGMLLSPLTMSSVDPSEVVITGTSEKTLGSATATALARANPAQILLLARTETKVLPVIHEIQAMNSSIRTAFVPISLDSLDSVRKAAAEINSSVDKIDVLINNAGVTAIPKYTTNNDGVEMTLATNHGGHSC